MSLASMERKLESALGWGEPRNPAQNWYASRNGAAFATAAWCDELVTWAAYLSEDDGSNYAAVCYGKDFAYTVWHAQEAYRHGAWRWGPSGIKRGAVVFFQWEGGERSFGKIDHVGFVTDVHTGAFETIEGNTNNRCARRLRNMDGTVAGWFMPNYRKEDDVAAEDVWTERIAVPDYGKEEYPDDNSFSAGGWLRGANIFARNARDEAAETKARVTALEGKVEEVGAGVAAILQKLQELSE